MGFFMLKNVFYREVCVQLLNVSECTTFSQMLCVFCVPGVFLENRDTNVKVSGHCFYIN